MPVSSITLHLLSLRCGLALNLELTHWAEVISRPRDQPVSMFPVPGLQQLLALKSLCVCVCVCMCECRCLKSSGKGARPLELELQAVVSCIMWVLGTVSGPSVRAANALNQSSVSSPVLG